MKRKIALCLRGAVSKNKVFCKKNDLYANENYVDYYQCSKSIFEHIVKCNQNYDLDFFCHCWNTDLENNIKHIYNPKKSLFESNKIYNEEISNLCENDDDFGGISSSLSVKKSIELKEKYEFEQNFEYDVVISYRYDVLLWKDINLDDLNISENNIYVNDHENLNGDFHFIMHNNISKKFKYLYDSILLGNKHEYHSWIKRYIIEFMNKNLISDGIKPGVHEEVLRKIKDASIIKGHLTLFEFNRYKNNFNELLPIINFEYNLIPTSETINRIINKHSIIIFDNFFNKLDDATTAINKIINNEYLNNILPLKDMSILINPINNLDIMNKFHSFTQKSAIYFLENSIHTFEYTNNQLSINREIANLSIYDECFNYKTRSIPITKNRLVIFNSDIIIKEPHIKTNYINFFIF